MASRQFLCALVHNLNLPVYGLFDFNLGGFRVYDTWSRHACSVPERKHSSYSQQGLHPHGPRGVEICHEDRLGWTPC